MALRRQPGGVRAIPCRGERATGQRGPDRAAGARTAPDDDRGRRAKRRDAGGPAPLRDRLLFVGLNPSPVSVDPGHYHQGKLGQTFWRRLIKATILPAGHVARIGRRCARCGGPRHHRPAEGADRAGRGDGRDADRRRRAALAEDRDLAAGGGRLRLQARCGDRGRSAARGDVGPSPRRRACRPAVLPDARAIRATR